ncbi:MAG: hypothetical protein PHE93_02200 [Clostridia bacterium]|nr:hypothetical protein [Clostridia bacterium]
MNRFFKLSILVVIIVVVAVFGLSACNTADTKVGVELLLNGNFEQWTTTSSSSTSGKFDNWTKGTLGDVESYTVQRMSHVSTDSTKPDDAGDYALVVTNSSASASYMSQSVRVDKNATYHIRYFVKMTTPVTVGADDYAVGPHLSFLENTDYVIEEVTTVGQWVEVNAYVVPRNTDYLTVCLMVGAEGRSATGTAYFDSVSMTKVDSVPTGTTIVEIFRDRVARYNINVAGTLFVTLIAVFSVLISICAYILIRRTYRGKRAFLNIDELIAKKTDDEPKNLKIKRILTHPAAIACYLGLGTLLVRLIFVFSMYGFGSEITNQITVSSTVFSKGILQAYASLSGANALMSPGELYILYIIGAMGKDLSLFDNSILIRMVSVLADIAVVLTIYFYGKHYVGNKLSTIYAGLYALLPIAFVLSGLRGSFTSVLIALVLLSIILMIEKKYVPMYALIVLAVLLDIRAMAVVPLMLFYLGYCYYRAEKTMQKFSKSRALILFGFILSLAVFYCLTIPFAYNYMQTGEPFFILAKYKSMVASTTAFVDNAFNLYGMVGMNQKTVNSTASIFNLIFILVLIIYVISLYVKNKNKLELLLLASFTFAVIAVFTLKVTETYLILSLALMLVYIMIAGEKRMYIVFSMYSVLAFLVLAQLMNQSGFVTTYSNTVMSDYESTGVFYILFSVVTVLTTLYYGYVTYSICNNSKTVDILPMNKPFISTVKDWANKKTVAIRAKNTK